MTVMVERSDRENNGTFTPSVSVNDFYWNDQGYSRYQFPMGHIENSGGLLRDIIFAESPPLLSVLARFLPDFGLAKLAKQSIGWWAQTGTLPDHNNRVYWQTLSRYGRPKKKLRYEFKPNNLEAHDPSKGNIYSPQKKWGHRAFLLLAPDNGKPRTAVPK